LPDVRLQASLGQDAPRWLFRRVDQGGGQYLVIVVEQVGYAAPGNLHPVPAQGGVDFRHAAVLTVAQQARQGDDVQAELVLRQRQRTLRLRLVRDMKAGAPLALAAADPHP
jgi:hypothetical protein